MQTTETNQDPLLLALEQCVAATDLIPLLRGYQQKTEVLSNDEQLRVTGTLIDLGPRITRRFYAEIKPYHGGEHVNLTIEWGKKLAAFDQATSAESIWVELAMAWHDIDSESGPDRSEENSAEIIKLLMEVLGFAPENIQKVLSMILATRYHFSADGIMHQRVEPEESEYRQFPDLKDLLTKLKAIAADADLSNIGSQWDVYYEQVKLLAQEWGAQGDERAFWRQQSNFLQGILKRRDGGFYSSAARQLLSAGLLSNYTQSLQMVESLEEKVK